MPKAKAEKKPKAEKAPKEKKAKDPNAPKKPMGAYMWFCKATREDVKKEHPEWGVADIGRELGQRWKAVSDKDKKKFEAEAAKDKERYEKEMKSYKPE